MAALKQKTLEIIEKSGTHIPTAEEMKEIPPEQKGILGTLGNLLGLTELGKGLALSLARIPGIRRIAAPEITEIEEKIGKGEPLTPGELAQYSTFFGEAPTAGETIKGAAKAMIRVPTAIATAGAIERLATKGLTGLRSWQKIPPLKEEGKIISPAVKWRWTTEGLPPGYPSRIEFAEPSATMEAIKRGGKGLKWIGKRAGGRIIAGLVGASIYPLYQAIRKAVSGE